MKGVSQQELRRHAAELLIALCLCGGGYFFFVEPADAALMKTRALIIETQRECESVRKQRLNWAAAHATLDRIARQAGDIDARGRTARDEAMMFTSLSQIAADSGVLIDAIQPARQTAVVQPPPANPDDPLAAVPPPNDVVTSYTIDIRGSYASLIRFIATIEHDDAYTLVQRLQLQTISDPEQQLVRAVVKIDRLAFDTATLHAILVSVEKNGGER